MKDTILSLDYTNITARSIGAEYGLSEEDFSAAVADIERAVATAKTARPTWGFTELPSETESVDQLIELADSVAASCEDFIVVGIGGSALGNITLQTALNPPYYNLMSREARGGRPRIHVPDNIDPALIGNLLATIDPKTAFINVIAKSGRTSETLSNFLVLREFIEKAHGENWTNRLVITTDPENGPLRALANEMGIRTLAVPSNVGGRFSVLCPVGLFSAAVGGIDIRSLLAGAGEMLSYCDSKDWQKNPAFFNAVIHYLYDTRKQIRLSVMMPYAQSLREIADWFRQLWAESLGKQANRAGEEVYCGLTPIKALGATDQHSQIQLYAEGPVDKLITFIHVKDFGITTKIPQTYGDNPAFSYLGDKSLNELLHAEEYATRAALTKASRPNLTVTLPEVTPYYLGQLLMFLELQTAYIGELYDINVFDQPGVEQGKIFTSALMGREEFDEARGELESMNLSDSEYIL